MPSATSVLKDILDYHAPLRDDDLASDIFDDGENLNPTAFHVNSTTGKTADDQTQKNEIFTGEITPTNDPAGSLRPDDLKTLTASILQKYSGVVQDIGEALPALASNVSSSLSDLTKVVESNTTNEINHVKESGEYNTFQNKSMSLDHRRSEPARVQLMKNTSIEGDWDDLYDNTDNAYNNANNQSNIDVNNKTKYGDVKNQSKKDQAESEHSLSEITEAQKEGLETTKAGEGKRNSSVSDKRVNLDGVANIDLLLNPTGNLEMMKNKNDTMNKLYQIGFVRKNILKSQSTQGDGIRSAEEANDLRSKTLASHLGEKEVEVKLPENEPVLLNNSNSHWRSVAKNSTQLPQNMTTRNMAMSKEEMKNVTKELQAITERLVQAGGSHGMLNRSDDDGRLNTTLQEPSSGDVLRKITQLKDIVNTITSANKFNRTTLHVSINSEEDDPSRSVKNDTHISELKGDVQSEYSFSNHEYVGGNDDVLNSKIQEDFQANTAKKDKSRSDSDRESLVTLRKTKVITRQEFRDIVHLNEALAKIIRIASLRKRRIGRRQKALVVSIISSINEFFARIKLRKEEKRQRLADALSDKIQESKQMFTNEAHGSELQEMTEGKSNQNYQNGDKLNAGGTNLLDEMERTSPQKDKSAKGVFGLLVGALYMPKTQQFKQLIADRVSGSSSDVNTSTQNNRPSLTISPLDHAFQSLTNNSIARTKVSKNHNKKKWKSVAGKKKGELAGATNKGKKKGELADVTINIEYERAGSSKRKQIRNIFEDRTKKRIEPTMRERSSVTQTNGTSIVEDGMREEDEYSGKELIMKRHFLQTIDGEQLKPGQRPDLKRFLKRLLKSPVPT